MSTLLRETPKRNPLNRKRKHAVTLYLSDAEFDQLKRLAVYRDANHNELLRRMITNAARALPAPPPEEYLEAKS